jgi:hypothetical protein
MGRYRFGGAEHSAKHLRTDLAYLQIFPLPGSSAALGCRISVRMASNPEEPTFFTAPATQPPLDPRFGVLANAVRGSLHTATQYLIKLPPYATEQQKAVWMWHTALTTLAWDIGDIAIAAAMESSSLRGARTLNRMQLEYAARVHLYIADPALAETHMNEAVNMLRRVMKPVAAKPSTEPGIDAVKALVEAGTTKANQPKTRDMLAAMVATFIADPTKREPYVEFLDAEYAIGNGYVHGSQSSFFDIFDGKEGTLHPRSRVLHRRAEVLRCTNCMLALLVGLEKQYGQEFGVSDHVAALRSLGPYDAITSMGTHDTLMALLGVR